VVDYAALGLTDPSGIKLPPDLPERTEALAKAKTAQNPKSALNDIMQQAPDFIAGWAALGKIAFDQKEYVEAYAYYRVGYHRSLDKLRGSNWRGAGLVSYDHEPNQPFFHAVEGLMRVSAVFGDIREAERCAQMLLDADPADPLKIRDLTPDTLREPPSH